MKIQLHTIRIYAYHGCLPEETKIGGHYTVDVTIDTDFSEAAQTDDLNKTVDYCEVFEIVKEEMSIPSKLIEHVGKRIVKSLLNKISRIEKVQVCVTKIAPPMNGDVSAVSITIEEVRLKS
ncbi:MAG TPA: dihydroneopterin aldolase [Bacteroidia bacterium]|nr:dihydroneopterin aldolase [Bacteroidia bacterium]HNP98245.1 dihydroneopterin aldolase [Bacteroidia bacterium]